MAMNIAPGEWDWMGAWGRDPFGRVAGIPQQPQGRGLMGALGGPQGLLNFGLAALAGSGYAPVRRTTGEILGNALLQTRQMADARREQEQRGRFMEAQIEAMQRPQPEPLEVVMGPDGKPRLTPRSEAAGQTPYMEPQQSEYAPGLRGEYERDVPPERRAEVPYFKWLQQRTRATTPPSMPGNDRPTWANTSRGLMQYDESTGQWGLVPGTEPSGPSGGFNFRASDASVFARSAGQAYGGIYDPLTGQFSGLDKETAAKASRLAAEAARIWRESQGAISHNEAFEEALSRQRAPQRPAGTPRRGSAPPEAVEHLRRNPQLKEQFRRKYGYLPPGI